MSIIMAINCRDSFLAAASLLLVAVRRMLSLPGGFGNWRNIWATCGHQTAMCIRFELTANANTEARIGNG